MIKKKTTSKKTPIKKSPPKKKAAKTTPKKKTTSKATRTPEKVDPSVDILMTEKCQSLSGKSTLTYNIGIDDKDQVFIRILNNSGGGYFSKEWITFDDIKAFIGVASDEKPIVSFQLLSLFKSKSVNSPSFLQAMLLKEGLLKPVPDKKRVYAYAGEETFLAKVDKLKATNKAK